MEECYAAHSVHGVPSHPLVIFCFPTICHPFFSAHLLSTHHAKGESNRHSHYPQGSPNLAQSDECSERITVRPEITERNFIMMPCFRPQHSRSWYLLLT